MDRCAVLNLGRLDYASALAVQQETVAARKQGVVSDHLLLVEHPHVITLGRNGHMENLLASDEVLSRAGISFFPTDRGGDVTYHGPGQLVGYPILDLRDWRRDVGAYVRALEQSIIDTLADYDITAGRIAGLTGVWVGERKIAAIGVHLSRWVTSHGFALNVNTDLSYFQYIVPCGLTKPVTSMAALGARAEVAEVGRALAVHFGRIFDREMASVEDALAIPRKARSDMTDVVMPQMGESIVEGTLTKWLKKPGDRVERDEPLFEISTDKVDTEIPSPAAGTLVEALVEEGKTVGINTVVARIDEGGGAAAQPAPKAAPASAPPAKAAPEPAAPAAPAPAAPAPVQEAPAAQDEAAEPMGRLSPLVRKMARENNLDLSRVKGSGAGGRITKQDVEAHMAQGETAAAAPPPSRAAASAPASVPLPALGQAKTRIEPLSSMRAKIAEHMVMSKRTSAHVTTVHRVDMTAVARLRERHKATFQANHGFSLTYLPFLVRASVVALRQYPLLNASLDGTNIIHHNEINIGIAVALENGLIVPVIRAADEKNVLGLQRSIVDLASRARARQLKPEEVQGGTFSITNFGSFGSMIGTPIINQPQVAILGIGTVDKMPVVIDDAIAIRSICHVSLSFDHRLIDGALADQFMTRLKQVLESWTEDVL